jgi:hypothetical protein
MGGKLCPLPEAEALKVLEAAHVRAYTNRLSDLTYQHLGIDPRDVDAVLPVARAYGVRYLIVASGGYYEKYNPDVVKRGRIPLAGGLGWEYEAPDNFFHYRAGLTYSVWDCARQAFLFQTTTEAEASAAPWKQGELWPKFGMAVVQRIHPSATSAIQNQEVGDYSLALNIRDKVQYWSIQPVQSGTLGIGNWIKVDQMQRHGEWIELTVSYANDWSEVMNFSFSTSADEVICLDLNRSRYPVEKVLGRSRGSLRPGETTNVVFSFHIPDRNVDFVNFHVPLHSQVGSNWLFKATLTFENVPLFRK